MEELSDEHVFEFVLITNKEGEAVTCIGLMRKEAWVVTCMGSDMHLHP